MDDKLKNLNLTELADALKAIGIDVHQVGFEGDDFLDAPQTHPQITPNNLPETWDSPEMSEHFGGKGPKELREEGKKLSRFLVEKAREYFHDTPADQAYGDKPYGTFAAEIVVLNEASRIIQLSTHELGLQLRKGALEAYAKRLITEKYPTT